MLSTLETSILKELDRQRISSYYMSIIMNKLNDNDKKNTFLTYMLENRSVLITFNDIINEIKQY